MTTVQRFKAVMCKPQMRAFIAGIICAFGQAPWQSTVLAVLGYAVAAVLWAQSSSPRTAAHIGWFFGLGTFLISVSWLAEPFLVEPERHAWIIPFALAGMAGGLALFWALAFYLSKRLRTGLWGLVAFWGLAELARGYVLTGFPWALPAYIWLDTPVAQIASYIGPYGLTAMTFGLAALCARVYLKKSYVAAAWPVVYVGAMIGSGAFIFAHPLPADTDHTLRIVQPNAAQHLKWDPAYIPIFFERALDLSAPEGADLVIWPETSVAAPLYAAQPYLEQIASRSAPVQTVVGLQRVEGYRGYNSAAVIGTGGAVTQIYDKRHLVPFGEYMPLPNIMNALGLRSFTAQEGYGFSAGTEAALFDFGRLGKALPLICYEAIFPRDTRSEIRPDWLLQITNDAWFGKLSGPQQSLAQARFRAIELGLPMVRAANTGVSAITDARGTVRAFIPLGQAGALNAILPSALPPTLYARLGERGVFGFLIFVAVCAWLLPLRRIFRKTV